jgi:diguanylate cyclase (GGDEF)-like protein
MRFTIQRKLFYSHFIAVVLVSGSIGTFFYQSAVDMLFKRLQSRLMNSAAMISRAIDADNLVNIRASADVTIPSYQKNLQLIREFQAANDDIAFIYVMRKEGDKVVFVLDSDRSQEQALPGRIYTEEVPNLKKGFTILTADEKIACDEWGCFLSGYAPLKNGKGNYLLGIDMRADEVHQKFRDIRIAGIISLIFSIFLAYLFSWMLASRITRPIRLLVKRTNEIADGQFFGQVAINSRDEIGDLAKSFNIMSRCLNENNECTQQAMKDLEETKDSLENRVSERTARLADLNEQLRQEIEERKRAEATLEKAAATDYLTGLHNRRAMIALLEQEVKRIHRSGTDSSILLIDLDHFKDVNDNFGHETGDKVLINVAHMLRDILRDQDAVARWGGEELLILLPGTSISGAVAVAEKIRMRFVDHPFTIDDQQIRITASIGVCPMTRGMSTDECFRRADTALYQAKSKGRNQTVAAN